MGDAWRLFLLFTIACSGVGEDTPRAHEEIRADSRRAADAGTPAPDGGGGATRVRIMAANVTSGPGSSYDPEESVRLFQGLHADIALVQELKVGDGTEQALADFVRRAFGEGFAVVRETDAAIPNGIVSRFPILTSGQWDDPEVSDRGFSWARIALPGPRPLLAVSVHLLTTGSTRRNAQARALVAKLSEVVAPSDHVVVGGDLNTSSRSEPCLRTLSPFVVVDGPYPSDQKKDNHTNRRRDKPYDWVLVDPDLSRAQIPAVVGRNVFPSGLVFDSRVYAPLDEVAPIRASDSDALNMQHMPVVRDFAL